jgi:hypothetical protein
MTAAPPSPSGPAEPAPGSPSARVETRPIESIITRDCEKLVNVGRELSAERRDQLIEEMARKVDARRLETVAVFMLEAHRPLSFVASQGLLMTAPFLGAFFGFDKINDWAKILEDRENLDRLIDRIEQLARER